MKIVGTKFFGHDSAICYLDTEKKEIFAISTERVTRIKHDDRDVGVLFEEYPFLREAEVVCHSAADFCNRDTMIENKKLGVFIAKREEMRRKILKPRYISDIEWSFKKIVKENFWKHPILSLRLAYYHLKVKELEKKEVASEENKKALESFLREKSGISNIKFYDHHLCHATGAFYTSPFVDKGEDVILFTLDGQGDGYFSKLFLMKQNQQLPTLIGGSPIEFFYIKGRKEVPSIGHLYMNFTSAMGLRFGDEGKVEARAAYGSPDRNLYDRLKEAIWVDEEELKFKVNTEKLKPFHDIEQLKRVRKEVGDENFAATIQRFLEDVVVEYLNRVALRYPHIHNLCLAGGVTANIIMSLNIFERTPFKNIHVFPAMADDGTALGAALIYAVEKGEDIRWVKEKYMPYYGPAVDKEEIQTALKEFSNLIEWEYLGDKWPEIAADEVVEDKIVAVVQGRMEFGPRALGNRSIIANAFNPATKDKINSTVKRRPWYQPFCPSILEEDRERLFEESFPHKHMAIAFRVKKEFRKEIPSGIHIDGTARPQFVEERDNPSYYRLLKRVKEKKGIGIVINTSFNLHGRTIVRTPTDALTDFIDCNIDTLFMEGYRITRKRGKS
jgi:carbamoyltransferase